MRAMLLRAGWMLGLPCWLACAEGGPPAIGCGELAKGVPPERASVVLVLNDTMRRDRIGIHGGPARTPHFDRFAGQGLWFARAVSQASWTKPSIATLFTSHYPAQHGVVTHPAGQLRAADGLSRGLLSSDRLAASAVTVAEAYRAAGFRTAAFVANPWMDRRFGFEQGFEHYDDSFARWGAKGEDVMGSALAWLATLRPEERFFVYIHTIDSHRPYPALTWDEVETALEERPLRPALAAAKRPEIASLLRLEGPRPQGARPPPDRRIVRRAYDKGIESFDEALGQLLRGLERDPRRDRIGVIVTSDHGEALYRRGYGNHGLGLYQAELAVPLAARLPGAGRGRIDCRAGLIDVMPTLCDWSELSCPSGMAGRSLFDGEPGAKDSAGIYHAQGTMLDAAHRALYQRQYKLMYTPGRRPEMNASANPWALFDLRADPAEERNLLIEASPSPAVERVFTSLRGTLEEEPAGGALLEPGAAPIDPALEERLRSLGYLD